MIWSKVEALETLNEYLKQAKDLRQDIKTNSNTKCRLPYVRDRADLCEANLDMIFLSFEDIEINIQDGFKIYEGHALEAEVVNENLQLIQKNCEVISIIILTLIIVIMLILIRIC